MSTVLLDTHVLQWWKAEPERVSARAAEVLEAATELAVSSITWWELGWLAAHDRISINVPLRTWLGRMQEGIRTVSVTSAIAATAVELPTRLPADPADRLIYATAVEHGWPLVTKDRRLRGTDRSTSAAIW